MYPVFHVSCLEPYHKLPKSLVPQPSGDEEIIHILNARKVGKDYQYLVTYKNYNQEWVNAGIIDDNPYYDPLLKDYQDFCYEQFLANVASHNVAAP